MPDDTNDDEEEHSELEQSEGGTMGSNLPNEEGDGIQDGGVDSGYSDDDDAPAIEQSSGETLKPDDSDPIGESDEIAVGGGDSGYGDFTHDEDDRSGDDE